MGDEHSMVVKQMEQPRLRHVRNHLWLGTHAWDPQKWLMKLIRNRRENPWRYKDENFKSNNVVSHLTSHWVAPSIYLPMDWRGILGKDWSNERNVTLGSFDW